MTSVFSVFLNHCGLLFNDGILSETNIGNNMETTVFFLSSLADGVLKCGGVLGFCGVFVGFGGFYQQIILFEMTKYFK